jgi:hypothetical protein
MNRTFYFIFILTIMGLGLLSRHVAGVPLFIGDILWGLMIYLMVRFLFINRPIKWAVFASLIFCYAIEFSQLYQATWINNIRHTVLGGLILGEVFLWSDMLCYTIGVGLGMFIDLLIKSRWSN